MVVALPGGGGGLPHSGGVSTLAQMLDGFDDAVGLGAQFVDFAKDKALRLAPLPIWARPPFEPALEILEEIRLVEPVEIAHFGAFRESNCFYVHVSLVLPPCCRF